MANLICDLHFWSLRDDLAVRDTDFSSFKYFDKTQQKTILEKPYAQVKRICKNIEISNIKYGVSF